MLMKMAVAVYMLMGQLAIIFGPAVHQFGFASGFPMIYNKENDIYRRVYILAGRITEKIIGQPVIVILFIYAPGRQAND
jgi:hypothetical protein